MAMAMAMATAWRMDTEIGRTGCEALSSPFSEIQGLLNAVKMGITVAVKVEHLPIANALVAAPASEKSRTVLVPNLDYHGTVRDTLNAFISRNLFLPEECQLLSAPLFTRLSEKDNVDDIYKRYSCQVQLQSPA